MNKMKLGITTVVAAAIILGTSRIALADGLSFNEPDVVVPAQTEVYYGNWDVIGQAEYQFAASRTEMRLGVEYSYANFAVRPMVVGEYVNSDFNFVGTEVQAIYGVSDNVNLYGSVMLDNNFDYANAEVGVAFRF